MNVFRNFAAAALVSLFLAACGSSSNNSETVQGVTPNTTTDTVVSGMATKGPVTGTVSFYTVSAAGGKGSLLKSSPVAFGRYSTNIGKYAGPVVIEVTGNYTDEATGKDTALEAPLRAALPNAAGVVKAAVTPLTELAVQKAGALNAKSIADNNKLVSDIFKFDVINTLPVAPEATALNSTGTSQPQKDYTLALAAISQLRQTNKEPLSTTLASFVRNMTSSGMNAATVAEFIKAVGDTKTANTAFKDVSTTNLDRINGLTTVTYTLAIQGNIAAKAIKGIQFEMVLPVGLSIRSDAVTGIPLAGIVSPVSAVSNAATRYSTSNGVLYLGFLSDGIGAGDLATIICDVVPVAGGSAPPAALPYIRNIKADGGVVDGNSVTVSGVGVTVR